MRISGFSFARNAEKLYYPLREAILSVLPMVDEFVVAIGAGDPDDHTREMIASIPSDKIRIIDTQWDTEAYPRGMENAHQTDIAKSYCTGDWLLYLQADEVIHEKYLPVIRQRCEELLHEPAVEGLLFKYRHFWGNYDHCLNAHGWYKQEIRIIRNDPEIHSWESAQSFRRIPGFDGKNYRQQEGTQKLRVAWVDAEVFHYGWVRPPLRMQSKSKALTAIHKGDEKATAMFGIQVQPFDYGNMSRIPKFNGSHPEVMKSFISNYNWENSLRYSGPNPSTRDLFKHERMKYRIISWIENNLLCGRELGGFHNYSLIRTP
jgi:hypothetical protein